MSGAVSAPPAAAGPIRRSAESRSPALQLAESCSLTLELSLAPDAAGRLPRLLRGGGRSRPTALRLIWHDTPTRALAADGLALAERRQGKSTLWRLERTRPEPATPWPPGLPCPVLAEAPSRAALAADLPGPLIPIAGFEGQTRTMAADGGVTVTLLSGTLRAAADERPCCRVALHGPGPAVAALADRLAATLPLDVPRAALADAAAALAGHAPRPRRLGAPVLPADLPVGAAFAHLAGHLTDVMLHHATGAASGAGPEPVHQMRVAMRRLRSAIGLFRRAVACPALDDAEAGLKLLSRRLGPTRDWDVFIAGSGRAIAAALPEDASVRRLLAAAARARLAAYQALREHLESAAFRRLAIALAVLAATQPWEATANAEAPAPSEGEAGAAGSAAGPARQARLLAAPLAPYAARMLRRRLAPLRQAGDDVPHLPEAALHDIRLHGKRLRYAAEFFAPLFPGTGAGRFIRRLTALQERLGHLNDGAVATGLMAELGAGRSHAGGVVRGFVAAQATDARTRIERAWRRFNRLDPFWK